MSANVQGVEELDRRRKVLCEVAELAEVFADVEIGTVKYDIKEGEGGARVVYDLVCKPEVFGT